MTQFIICRRVRYFVLKNRRGCVKRRTLFLYALSCHSEQSEESHGRYLLEILRYAQDDKIEF